MTPLTIRELEPDAGTRRFAVRLWEGENVLTETELRALRDAADTALNGSIGWPMHKKVLLYDMWMALNDEADMALDPDDMKIAEITNKEFWNIFESRPFEPEKKK